MIFKPLALTGAFLIDLEPQEDHRGFYARTFSAREFAAHGLTASFIESGISHTIRRGTVRGMHMQIGPHAQAKLVRCNRGAIYDVMVDMRRDSPTFCRWLATSLSSATPTLLYVPGGFAHGFQALEDETEVTYQFSEYYNSKAEAGVRWNDPRFGIAWPIADVILSDRDRGFADFLD